MSQKEQQLLREALDENFPEKSMKEREEMFQSLIDAGGTETYIKIINEKVWRVGVVLGPNRFRYYETEHEPSTAWLYED